MKHSQLKMFYFDIDFVGYDFIFLSFRNVFFEFILPLNVN